PPTSPLFPYTTLFRSSVLRRLGRVRKNHPSIGARRDRVAPVRGIDAKPRERARGGRRGAAGRLGPRGPDREARNGEPPRIPRRQDRKSTRLNSSHQII